MLVDLAGVAGEIRPHNGAVIVVEGLDAKGLKDKARVKRARLHVKLAEDGVRSDHQQGVERIEGKLGRWGRAAGGGGGGIGARAGVSAAQ